MVIYSKNETLLFKGPRFTHSDFYSANYSLMPFAGVARVHIMYRLRTVRMMDVRILLKRLFALSLPCAAHERCKFIQYRCALAIAYGRETNAAPGSCTHARTHTHSYTLVHSGTQRAPKIWREHTTKIRTRTI